MHGLIAIRMAVTDNQDTTQESAQAMSIAFWFFWILDLLILLVCLYETFLVSSNSSLLWPSVVMAVLLAAATGLKSRNQRAALLVAGLPAGMLLCYALMLALRSDWR